MKLIQKEECMKATYQMEEVGTVGITRNFTCIPAPNYIAEGGAYEWTIYFKYDLETQNKIDEQASREYLAFIKAELDPESEF